MRILFGAHGSILQVFHSLDLHLRSEGVVVDSSYWVSDSQYFFANEKELSLFRDKKVSFLKEWDYTNRPAEQSWKPEELDALEKKYGEPFLWNAVISDRRLMYGPLCKVVQDYSNRFDHDELCSIICNSLKAIDAHVEKFKPNCIMTFVPASFGDYLLYLVAKARGIPFLHLKSTKVKNYVTLNADIYENPDHIYKKYEENLRSISSYAFADEAKIFLADSAKGPLQYEGNIVRAKASALKKLRSRVTGFLSVLNQLTFKKHPVVSRDNHIPPVWGTYVETAWKKERREKKSRAMMLEKRFDLKTSAGEKYVFFPLHSEPEIALSVYGRNHQNQIEAIRRMAQSLPMSWKLVVKEHPRTFSYRSRGYYKKLREIPNVYFAEPEQHPFYLIKEAQAVVTISGFVGIEALVVGKPLLILGEVTYDVLPKTMIRKIHNFDDFAPELKDLLQNFKRDDSVLQAFVAACMSESVNINLYSDLLKKGSRVSFGKDSFDEQIRRVAEYFKKRYREITAENLKYKVS